jgi:alpha-D-ribose 1-methylphosphonate 5-triphosphate synthase subunit PhnH
MTDPILNTTRFSDAALHAQGVFRQIMTALSEPGRIVTLPAMTDAAPPLSSAGFAVLRTLCDFETSLWLSPAFAAATDTVRFHTDTRMLATPDDAAFAVVGGAELDLTRFTPGTAAYPDRGATVIVEVPALTGGPARTLSGPGIKERARFEVAGLPADIVAQLKVNRGHFPLGVDLLFVCGEALVGLPRSTRIHEGAS